MSVLRGLLFDNLGLKLVALLLALLVYLHVFTERPATMVVSFPLEFADLADSLTLSGPVPQEVRAELRGTGKQFIRLWLTEPRFRVSLRDVGTGRYERRIGPDDLPLSSSDRLEIERLVSPQSLAFMVERRLSRSLPVAPRIVGAPREGTTAGRAVAEPPTVVVRGPLPVVMALDSLATEGIRIAGRRDTLRAQARITGVPEWCTVEPAAVIVTVPMSRKRP